MGKISQIKWSKTSFVGLGFWLLIVLLYSPAYRAGFMGEVISMFHDYEQLPFVDFLNRKNADVVSFYQWTQLQLWLLITFFKTNFLLWFLLFTLLHALNGALAFRFFKRLFLSFNLPQARLVALLGVGFWLINPHITEVTIWKAGYHYLVGIFMQLYLLNLCQDYLLKPQKKQVWLSFILMMLSAFSIELFYTTPFFLLFLCIGYSRIIPSKNAFKNIVVPAFLIFTAHLILYRFCFGHWVAHYGGSDSFVFDWLQVAAKMMRYLSSLILFSNFWDYDLRMSLFHFFDHEIVSQVFLFSYFLMLASGVLRWKKLKDKNRLILFFLASIFCCLLLISPIYFDDLFTFYNSRRCYQLSLFAYVGIGVVASSLFKWHKKNWYLISFIFIVCISITVKQINHWQNAASLQYKALNIEKTKNKKPIILLNLPTYFQGIRMLNASNEISFSQQQQLFCGKKDNVIAEVAGFNMNSFWDGAHITLINDSSLLVTLNQWGSWWLYNYQGAVNYETVHYNLTMTDAGHQYRLTMKKAMNNYQLLFFASGQWHQLDANGPKEQW